MYTYIKYSQNHQCLHAAPVSMSPIGHAQRQQGQHQQRRSRRQRPGGPSWLRRRRRDALRPRRHPGRRPGSAGRGPGTSYGWGMWGKYGRMMGILGEMVRFLWFLDGFLLDGFPMIFLFGLFCGFTSCSCTFPHKERLEISIYTNNKNPYVYNVSSVRHQWSSQNPLNHTFLLSVQQAMNPSIHLQQVLITINWHEIPIKNHSIEPCFPLKMSIYI